MSDGLGTRPLRQGLPDRAPGALPTQRARARILQGFLASLIFMATAWGASGRQESSGGDSGGGWAAPEALPVPPLRPGGRAGPA